MTVTVATLGFPRIGPRRELKFALEKFWSGKTDETALATAAAGLRTAAWARQHALGADWLPAGDFSLYDHMLDMSMMLGAVPARYGATPGAADLATRSEEHTSELQSLMRISYAVYCLKKKITTITINTIHRL